MYQQALKGYEKAWGQCIRRCWTQPTPGLFDAEQGKTEEAEAMYQWVLKGNELTWGPEHTSTLRTVTNMGNLYKGQGKIAAAETMY